MPYCSPDFVAANPRANLELEKEYIVRCIMYYTKNYIKKLQHT